MSDGGIEGTKEFSGQRKERIIDGGIARLGNRQTQERTNRERIRGSFKTRVKSS